MKLIMWWIAGNVFEKPISIQANSKEFEGSTTIPEMEVESSDSKCHSSSYGENDIVWSI